MTIALGECAGRARRIAYVSLLAAFIALLVQATSAEAGIIQTNVNVKGAGLIVGVTVGYGCDRFSNLDDRVTTACPPAISIQPGITLPMQLNAIAQPQPPGHWQVTWLGCDSSAGGICTINDPGPFNSRVANVTAVFNDVFPPGVSLAAPTFSTTVDRTVRFPFTANEPGTFTCKIDSQSARACTQNTDFTLSEGPHALRVQGTDRSGNAGPLVGPLNFQVLDTKLISGPATFSRTKSATFKFSTLAGFSFDCSLDGAPLVDCGNKLGDNTLTKSFPSLSEGAHTFRVRARDGTDIDHVPVVRTWTVDTVRPNTTLDPLVGPRDGEVSTLLTAAFSIAASEASSLQCRLDSAPFAACPASKSFASLGFGQHRFEARAIDRAGNVDLTPISRTWTVLAVDNDGDGFNQRSDCNDADPLIRPGAREIAGNSVDENCDRFVAPPPRMSSTTVPNGWSVLGRGTTLTKLQVKRLRKGAKVEIRCLGKKCSFKRAKAKGKPKGGKLDLLKTLKGKRRRFVAGQTLEVRITAPRVIGKVVRYKMRAGRLPKVQELCLPPGARQPQRCT